MALPTWLTFSPDNGKSMGNVEELWAEALWSLLPLWVAVFVGLILGWSWKPKWVTLLVVAVRSRPRLVWSLPPGLGARRLWFAATAAAAAPTLKGILAAIQEHLARVQQRWKEMQVHLRALRAQEAATFFPAGRLTKRAQKMLFKEVQDAAITGSPVLHSDPAPQVKASPLASEVMSSEGLLPPFLIDPSRHSAPTDSLALAKRISLSSSDAARTSGTSTPSDMFGGVNSPVSEAQSPTSEPACEHGLSCAHSEVVTEEDLQAFLEKLEDTEGTRGGGQAWAVLMEKKTQRMTYTAWRRDPQNGPTEYRSRTVLEDCSPETMRDFFWDDDFRPEWDGMLAQWDTLEACPSTGLQIVRWVRKFPLFCKDREYIIGRRIWSLGNTYYCLTKGLAHHPDAPRKEKPRRVDHFYSSWRIQALEGGRCEVMLFHQEDMGIQRDVAKMGVRQGMWGAVKKIEPGVRSFRQSRAQLENPAAMSRSLSMARLHTPLTELASPTSKQGSITLGEHRRVRQWVSSLDLTQVAAAAAAATERDTAGGMVRARSSNRVSFAHEGEDSAWGPPVAEVSEEQERTSEGTHPAESRRETEQGVGGGEASSPGGERPEGVARGLEVVRAKGRDVAESGEGRGKHLRLIVAATAVAFVFGLETGCLVKVALAGAVRHALCARRQRRGA